RPSCHERTSPFCPEICYDMCSLCKSQKINHVRFNQSEQNKNSKQSLVCCFFILTMPYLLKILVLRFLLIHPHNCMIHVRMHFLLCLVLQQKQRDMRSEEHTSELQ